MKGIRTPLLALFAVCVCSSLGRAQKLFFCCALTISLSAMLVQSGNGAEKVEFNRDIRPILSEKCFQCHGPDEDAREAELRLDIADEEEGPFRSRNGSQAIKPGDLEASAIWYRLTTCDEDEAMPPKDSGKQPLTDQQRELFKQWILQGAEYEDFWAFVPPKPQTAPDIHDTAWSLNRIDPFVMARLEILPGIRPAFVEELPEVTFRMGSCEVHGATRALWRGR